MTKLDEKPLHPPPTLTVDAGSSAPTRRSSPRVRRAPQRIGKYVVTGSLGRGGMGVVFSAIDEVLGASVALKAVPAELDDTQLRALKREFRAVRDFASEHVVRMYDLFVDGGSWYIAMERIVGSDFVTFLRRIPAEERERRHRAVGQLLRGARELHAAGWVHRDIKASNVLVEDHTERVVFLDFGLAEAIGASDLRESRLLGTLSHMAPELFERQPAGPASDMFAIGVMLAHALCEAGTSFVDADAARRALSDAGDVEPVLVALCKDCLSDEASRRPTAADALGHLAVRNHEADVAAVRLRDAPAPLFGREPELERLLHAFSAGSQRPVHVEIEAPAGMGKTALTQAFVSRVVADDRARVLRSRCHVHERIPFNAVDSLVDELAATLLVNPSLFEEKSESLQLSHAAEMFPTLRSIPRASEDAPTEMSPVQRRAAAFEQICGLFRVLQRRSPVLMVLEDVHWGDADSGRLLRTLLEKPTPAGCHPLRAMWTTRPGAEEGDFARALREGRPDFDVQRIQLNPLDEVSALEVARAVRPDLGDAELGPVLEEARGNPLLLTKAVLSVGRLRRTAGQSILQAMMDGELQRMPDEVREFLKVLAVASAPLDASVILSAVQRNLDVHRVLDDLRNHQLVTVHAEGGLGARTLEVYHDKIREPLLARMPPSEQTTVHGALARALEEAGNPSLPLVAFHFHEAGDDEKASSYAVRAARAADGALAFASAAKHYGDALSWGVFEGAHLVELRRRLAAALFNAGRCAESAQAYEVARQCTGGVENRSLAALQATAWFSAGHVDEGMRCIGPVLRQLKLSAPRPRWLMPSLALKILGLRLRRLEVTPGVDVDDERAFRADVSWSLGQGLSMFLSARGAYFAVQSLIESSPTKDPHRVGRALAFVGGICANMGGRMSAWGDEWLGRAEAIARNTNDDSVLGWCQVWRANSELVRGNFLDAETFALEAIDLMEGGPYAMSWECHTARCFLLMARERLGRFGAVAELSSELARRAETMDDLYGRVVFSLFEAQMAAASGDVPRARWLADSAMRDWTKDHYTVQHFYALRVNVTCDLQAGDVDAARERLETQWRQVEKSEVMDVPSSRLDAEVLLLRVQLAAATAGQGTGVVDVARLKSVSRRSREGAGYAHLLSGAYHRVRDEGTAAAERAAAAAVIFDELNMRVMATVARCCADLVADPEAPVSALSDHGVGEPRAWLRAQVPGYAR